MKKIILQVVTVGLLLAVIGLIVISMAQKQQMVVTKEGNTAQKPLPIKLGSYQDSDCGMIIEDLTYASQVIAPGGRTWFFHDHGGMAHWLENKEFAKDAVIWVYTKDTKRWIDGKEAWYSLTDDTPMNYGFGAYEHKQEGFVDFATMQRRMLQGRTLNNPKVKRQLLGSD
ncbi:MAG: hypothetical protein ACQERK_03235 [Campylobacterota bacterium]